ncbi:MAG: hypothetical protein JWM20_778 [Patescibacteria group bacterium]|nr:hypothetical protein [Patescibacteria group bacterium]
MCGIVGIVGEITKKEYVLRKMNDKIIHRGPDDEGVFLDDGVALGMRRLSIIDIEHGKQPITTTDGNFTIVFNGEIYNYKILRAELEAMGIVFQTNSDTEAILLMFQKFGPTMVTRLRGMFAFAIYDKTKKSLFIARDYFGIKPLYYLKQEGKILAFGSEIKSILEHPSYSREINHEAALNYLSFQYNPTDETFFKNIYKLAPGSTLLIDLATGNFKEEKYWDFKIEPNQESNSSVEKKIESAMNGSVAAHMIADVPVGSFLSGGIDSGMIATYAAREAAKTGRTLSTFTIGSDQADEWSAAREVADVIKSDHQEINLDWKEYFSTLPKIAYHFDEPVADPSAVALYFLAREARKKVKVVLSGEGADELFGGYNIYLEPYARRSLQKVPLFIRKAASWFARKIPISFPGKNYLKRSVERLEDWYIGNATIWSRNEARVLWRGKPFSPSHPVEDYAKGAHSDSAKMQLVDINTWLVGDILAKADKMTMAHSLEARVPFLDIEVSKIASQLTDSQKWHNGQTKYLLREAAKSVIPETTRKRKKLGFPTPLKSMIAAHQSEIEKAILENSYLAKNLDQTIVKKVLEDHATGRRDNSRKIFALLMLAIWHETFFNNAK